MAERIELPGQLQGTADQKLDALYSYLYRMATAMNANLAEIGPVALTDDEQVLMNQLNTSDAVEMPNTGSHSWQEAETLKSLIIKTATIVKTALDAYRLQLFGETEADSEIGKYIQKKGLRVDVTPDGIKQTYSFAEIIKGLKTYEINAKNYIKTGYLRTVNNVPVYGVAVGRDIVTFAEDGTETYHDGNKVAELTADELSFYANGALTAKYSGNRISFYQGGTEAMYLSSGCLYTADDLYIGSGGSVWMGLNLAFNAYSHVIWNRNGMYVDSNPIDVGLVGAKYGTFEVGTGKGTFKFDAVKISNVVKNTFRPNSYQNYMLGEPNTYWDAAYINDLYYNTLHAPSSREKKKEIREIRPPGEKIDGLRPVTFIYKDDPEEVRRSGLIWEDTIDVMPEICKEKDGEKSIAYMELVPMLVKEIQELRARVKALEEKED